MELHGNAKLTPYMGELMCRRVVEEGWTVAEAAEAAGCSERTCYRWLSRWRDGEEMTDRSSAPHRVVNCTPDRIVAMIEQLRRVRWTSTRIAAELDLATSTVCAVLTRLGLPRRSRLEPQEPPNRYCRRHPGELIHVDVKKLGRFKRPGHRVVGLRAGYRRDRHAGWEFAHIAIDDTSRLAYLEILADEKGPTCVAFLERAVAWFAEHGVIVERVMIDNGGGYSSTVHAAGIERQASDTCAPSPTDPARTARPNDSSRPSCASAPTAKPSRAASNAAAPYDAGSLSLDTPMSSG